MTDYSHQNDLDEAVCPRCLLVQADWIVTHGYISQTGEVYCCEDCARGKACRCSTTQSVDRPFHKLG